MNIRTRLLLMNLLLATGLYAQQVEWISTTNEARWQKSNKVELEDVPGNANVDLDIVLKEETAQYIDGFGGCFNEMGWDALSVLSGTERKAVIENLFSPEEANFNYNRMPMGASDYGMGFYSFNDVADDFKMINFSIDRDRHVLLQYIKAAQKENPDFRIWASPWSPPAWMKTNNHYGSSTDSGGTDYNGLPWENSNSRDATGFKMLNGYLKAYALYFSKFIRAYEKEGVPVVAVHVQNEPCSNQKFPSCKWRAEDLAYFIGEFLGPEFEKEKIRSDIYFGTINTSKPEYIRAALNDEKAAGYIKGVGFQWSGKAALPTIHKEYPDLKYIQTESECGNGSNSWEAAEYTWGLIHHYMVNGASAYVYWNMVLDDTGMSRWGWKQNALISVNKETGKVTYNPEYFIMKHVSRYVMPGAYRLLTNESNNHLAFVNPDGKTVVVVVNKEESDKTIKIGYRNKMMTVKMKAKSFNTFRF